VRVDFDGAPIEEGGFVTPLAHGAESRWIKYGIAFDDLQGANCAVDADEGMKFDAAFATGLAGQRGENGLHAMNEHGRVEVCDVHDAWRGRGWDYGLNAALAEELDASSAFWTSVFDDIGASEAIVRARGVSGLRVRW
jgi:hypothetical protein